MTERLTRLHKISLYAVVGAAFVAAATSRHIGGVTAALFVAGSAASWVVDARDWTSRQHVDWWNAFAAAVLALFAIHVVWFGGSPMLAGVRFILVLTVIRLVSRHRERDELQLYALAFLTMASATALNDGLTYGVAFGAFVLTGTFSLALFHLKWEIRGRRDPGLRRSSPFDRRYAAVLAGLSLAILAASVVLFVAFPRVGLGFFESNSRERMQVSGFSDSVRLGTHGVDRDDPSVVLRAEFPTGRPSEYRNLHWRTLSFDHYDGRSWKRKHDHRLEMDGDGGRYDLASMYGEEMPKGDPRDVPERIDLYVEPLGEDVLPTLWPTESVRFKLDEESTPRASSRSGQMTVDMYGDLSHTVESDIGIPYSISVGRRPDPDELRGVQREPLSDHRQGEPFLQLPGTMRRIESLARRVTEDAETTYAKAEAIETYLRANFEYTTDLPEYDADAPVQDFLFDRRRGHCEYFATAMTLMLRSLGIPARLVNGFLGGEWNSVGGYLAIRQQDAHSWVEFELPGYGWIPMDPTPTATIQRDRSAALDWFRQSHDALRMLWYRWVLEYDLDTQLRLLRRFGNWREVRSNKGSGDDSAPSESADSSETNRRPVVTWGGLALLCLFAVGVARRFDARFEPWKLAALAAGWSAVDAAWLGAFRGFGTSSTVAGLLAGFGSVGLGAATSYFGSSTGAPPPTRLFERIERAAGASGLERKPGEPPAAFLNRLAGEHPELGRLLKRFRSRYLAARFGGRTFDPETRRQVEETVDEICERL